MREVRDAQCLSLAALALASVSNAERTIACHDFALLLILVETTIATKITVGWDNFLPRRCRLDLSPPRSNDVLTND
jgi:hypothetical protein